MIAERPIIFKKRRAVGECSTMLIDQQFRESVGFLMTESDTSSAEGKKPRGTCFFVLVQEADGEFGYVVTARHVIEKSRSHGPLYIRLNKSLGGHKDFRTDQDDWILHPKTDVAIIRTVGFPECRYVYIPSAWLATEAYVKKNEIGEGDEVFFIGLFSKHSGRTRIQPVVRFGHISLMPYEEINLELDTTAKTKYRAFAYLVESRSWGGHSGSPAFVFLPPYRRFGNLEISPPEDKMRLLGLVQGHYEISGDVKFTGELAGYGEGKFGVNAGMAAVIPADYITELLMRDDVIEERREALEKAKQSEAGPVPDITHGDDNFLTKNNFEEALRKVSRPKNKPRQSD